MPLAATDPARRPPTRMLGAALLLGVLFHLVALADVETFTVETEHYDVKTDISARFAEVIGKHMEAIFQEYSRRLERFGADIKNRFEVVVYADQESYDEDVPSALKGSVGAFVSKKHLLVSYRGNRTYESVLRTLYHEGFHQFMFEGIAEDCPIWLNEGLAEYFSEATWNGRGFTTGQVPTVRLAIVKQAIDKRQYLPLQKLFSLRTRDWLRNIQIDNSRASLQYCQAWSMVHFLLQADGGRHSGKLVNYLQKIREGGNHKTAFKESFGEELAGMERAWIAHVMDLKPSAKFVCRDRMKAIMVLALAYYEDPHEFKSVRALGDGILRSRRRVWRLTSPLGEEIVLRDRDSVDRLFTCPLDAAGRGESYVLLQNRQTNLPVLFCTHHPGIIIGAYFTRDERAGGYKAEVEEHVTETLPSDLRMALSQRGR